MRNIAQNDNFVNPKRDWGLDGINKISNDVKEKKRVDSFYKETGLNHYPVAPEINATLGPIVANVFGRIFSYCQMKDKCCKASIAVLARECNYCKRVVSNAIAECVKHGLIEQDKWVDKTKPKVYRLSKQLKVNCQNLKKGHVLDA